MDFDIFGHEFHFLTEERQWEKLFGLIQQYFLKNPASIVAVCLAGLILLTILITIPVHGEKKRMFNRCCLAAYAIVLLLLFIVCREQGTRGFRIFSSSWYISKQRVHESNVLITIINFLLFVPFGFLLRKMAGRNRKFFILLMIAGAAGAIEVLQFVLARGYTALQDVLSYVGGAWMGWLFMCLFDH